MRSFKRIAAMTMAVAMLCSFTALGAASVTVDPIDDITLPSSSATETVTIGYTGTEVAEVTMLAYAGTETPAVGDIVYANQITNGASGTYAFDLDKDSKAGTYTVLVGGTGLATAASETFVYSTTVPTYAVTIGAVTGGYVSAYDAAGNVIDLSAVTAGTDVTLKLYPHWGNKVKSLMIGANDAGSAEEYTFTVTGNTTITAEFEADPVPAEGALISNEIYDAPEVENRDGVLQPAKMVFGKAVAASGKTIEEVGMKVEKLGGSTWVEFVTPSGVGPWFKSEASVDAAYGIQFIGFTAGDYRIASYVKYVGEEYAVGSDLIEFTVE